MRPHVDFQILDDDDRWADPHDCADLVVAGIWYLYETLISRFASCPLATRITELGNRFESLRRRTGGDSSKLTLAEMSSLFSEMNMLGTLGHSLWHLRANLNSPALKYELEELSKVDSSENKTANYLRLRGQGFLLLAAANIAKQGFELEFIKRRKQKGGTPDFFAHRDGNKFCCEATTRYPEQGDFEDPEYFWTVINETIDRKTRQFKSKEFQNGVLLIDCTPVWDALDLSHIAVGGELVYHIPPNLGGPRSGSVPLIRYEDSIAAPRLRNLEEIIRGTGIHTFILWKHKLDVCGDSFRRHMKYRILGTIDGAAFWSYFGKALVFPGPNVSVNWA